METSKFDIADYLDSNEMVAEYLNEVLENGNENDLITAIGNVAKAIGMTKIAEKTGLRGRMVLKTREHPRTRRRKSN